MAEDIAIDKQRGTKVDCACLECHRTTKHEVVTDAVSKGYDQRYDVSWMTEYQIIRCLGCEALSFRRTRSNSEEPPIQVGPDEWIDDVHEDLYPTPDEGRQPLADADLLPDQTQRIYKEVIKALNNEQKVLCGIGVRAIVETVCKDQKAKGGDLYHQINSLVDLGVLTRDGAAILHKVRTLGNDAAHEVKPHKVAGLELALNVIDHLLLGVYILPEHAKRTFK